MYDPPEAKTSDPPLEMTTLLTYDSEDLTKKLFWPKSLLEIVSEDLTKKLLEIACRSNQRLLKIAYMKIRPKNALKLLMKIPLKNCFLKLLLKIRPKPT